MACANEPGWVPLSIPDGRRGIWARITKDTFELCSGREGGDEHVVFKKGESVTEETLYHAREVLSTYRYAMEVAVDNMGSIEEELKAKKRSSR